MDRIITIEEVIDNAVITTTAFFILFITIFIFTLFIRRKVHIEQLKRKELELQTQKDILAAIIQTQEEERSRIAKDLHDDVSSKLNAITMSLHILKQDELNISDRQAISNQTIGACNSLIENARSIAHNLMPPVLENIGLHLAIEELCQTFSQGNQVEINYHNPAGQEIFGLLSKENQIHFYRIVQELINNSLRHGNASLINLKFSQQSGKTLFTYSDNGPGLSKNYATKKKGIGMNNIISRAEIIQGLALFKDDGSPGFEFTLNY